MLAAGSAAGCLNEPGAVVERLAQAHRLAASLLIGFSKASDAANRAVMADTDEASGAFAREAEQATQAVERDAAVLEPILRSLGYAEETKLLQEFDTSFAKYRALDQTILGLAVENTNLKAQRLSFGSARAAADALRDSLDPLMSSDRATDAWRLLAVTAVAAVREIQALQAPHIAEADDAAMTRIETRMATLDAQAKSALEGLGSVVDPSSIPQLATAKVALDRFMSVNAEILALSRRNTNVRSLALSLGQKRALAAGCEDKLRALQDALAKRGFSATR